VKMFEVNTCDTGISLPGCHSQQFMIWLRCLIPILLFGPRSYGEARDCTYLKPLNLPT